MTGEKPKYRCWTKATRREVGPPRYSPSWLAARRAWLEVHDDRIVCGDWSIPIDAIQAATLYKTRQLMIPVSVLELQTEHGVFQFGLNPWASIARHLPFTPTQRNVRLRYSVFSMVARAVFFAALLWLIWQRFS